MREPRLVQDVRRSFYYNRIVKVVERKTGRLIGYVKINLFWPDAFQWQKLWDKGWNVYTL